MAYGSYSRSGGNYGAPWKPLMMGHVKTLTESEGWTTMENGYNDGTYTRWVFKSQSADFYILFFCLTTLVGDNGFSANGQLRVVICEDYDSGTKEFIKPAVLSTTATFAPAADGSLGTTKYSPTTLLSANIGVYSIYDRVQSSAYPPDRWIINAFSDCLSFSCESVGGIYSSRATCVAGKFTSLVFDAATNDPVCLGFYGTGEASGVGFTNTIQHGFTRSAMNGGKAAHTWGASAGGLISTTFHSHFGALPTDPWDLYAGGVGPSLSPIYLRRSTTADGNVFGVVRALVPKVLTGGKNGLYDDTLTIGSKEYVRSIFDSLWLRKG